MTWWTREKCRQKLDCPNMGVTVLVLPLDHPDVELCSSHSPVCASCLAEIETRKITQQVMNNPRVQTALKALQEATAQDGSEADKDGFRRGICLMANAATVLHSRGHSAEGIVLELRKIATEEGIAKYIRSRDGV